MKRKTMLIATFLTAIFMTQLIVAQNPNSGSCSDVSKNTPVSPISIVIKDKRSKGRPKAPSMQHIECWYEDGMLILDFAIPEGNCVLTVTEEQTGMSFGYSFDSASTAQVYIGEIWNATIEINTENGHSYEGWLGD